MKFKKSDALLYVPDGSDEASALARTTHMSVAAHPDDVEIMAYDGIAKCFGKTDSWFSAVILTDGTGSVKTGKYVGSTDREFKMARFSEQIEAAKIGEYGSLVMLDYSSREIKDASCADTLREIALLLDAARPETVYTHNPADKHTTHVAVSLRTIAAIRSLPKDARPKQLYGCEVWRSLDWLLDEDKTVFDVDIYPETAWKLIRVFESQISGAKKYDEAAMARRLSNSTFYSSHSTDSSDALIFALDLTPLISDDSLDISEYVRGYIRNFENEVIENIQKMK